MLFHTPLAYHTPSPLPALLLVMLPVTCFGPLMFSALLLLPASGA